ncbi:MAG: hypothetical protein PHU44_10635 [Syntrophales bacterium]|nr:hypothetical protein [Syntrophales bacterium]
MELIVAKAVFLMSYGLLQQGTITEPLLTQSRFTILILMVFITTFITPLSHRGRHPAPMRRHRPGFLPTLA